jgi:hypothetical protein
MLASTRSGDTISEDLNGSAVRRLVVTTGSTSIALTASWTVSWRPPY